MLNDLFGKQPLIVSLDIDTHVEQKIDKLMAAGLNAIELLQINASLVPHLRAKFPHLKIGLGNIHTVDQLMYAYSIGIDFMTSPGFYAPLMQNAAVYKMNYIPGVCHMSDAMAILNLGGHHARPCPGNLELCNLLNKYAPELKLYPMDVEWENIEQFLDLPSVAAVGLTNPDQLQMIQISESIQI
ncbi:MAG: 2-dehydro-3-deoxyphosphogluconate aldolase / (4S)-4-hydroxy-2-oxoglutarate aldolase [Pseudomonadota bacterium]|nr:2-dehydro-3-deoxyphosphogluconate aldolase / (4S)-4-hydroxy-2-oxoglutarate aldolase [Pseudomonadota bacterium]